MSSDRSLDRNVPARVHFYDATDPSTTGSDALGGLIRNGSVAEANFLQMLGILLIVEAPIHVQHRTSDKLVTETNNRLPIRTYDVYCESKHVIMLTEGIRDGIRARDEKCMISGVRNLNARRRWTSFEAAHIFPLGRGDYWNQLGLGRWITDTDDAVGISKINSCQNGFLLRQHIHGLFDQYLISVNPDDNYKITMFDLDMDNVDGRILDPVCRDPNDPHRSVLANMRETGEPVFESDFPPGMDMMEEIRNGPYAKERLELEVASRLRVST
ncbi:HNH endonuclease-domain-containing protein [Tuber indicum]|nr:HNH endonuclease-domain-containing protein [Tuber indicum]